ncbi:MAG TPA: sigma-70 family RNA polymerase sigma factor [Solirubrobacteraceae bacterium]
MTPHWHARASSRGDWRARNLEALFRRYAAGDRRAREAIIVRFLPLARRVAREYDGRGEPLDDLVQVASVGLIRAVDRYSPDRGDGFAPYARAMMVGEIRQHFRDRTWRVHVPRPTRDRAAQVLLADEALVQDSSSTRPEAIAEFLRIAPEEVIEARGALDAYRPASLDTPHARPNGDSMTLHEILGAGDPVYERVEMSVGVRRALLALKPRDRKILMLRLVCELTQEEIASRIGLSQMQISRILRSAGESLTASCGLAVSVGAA